MNRSALRWGVLLTVGIGAAAMCWITIAASRIETVFWKDLMCFIQRAEKNVHRGVADGTIYGYKVFLLRTQEGIKEIVQFYSKYEQNWSKTAVSRVVFEGQIPPQILERLRTQGELDITEELEMRRESA